MKRRALWPAARLAALLPAALVALGTGCDDGEDLPVEDGGPPVAVPPPLEAFTEGAFEPATVALGCRGTRAAPSPGAPIDVTFQLRDFSDDFEVPDITVWLFSDNTIADSCAPPGCQELVTDGMGDARATLPADGWYAYRVLPYMDPSGSQQLSVFGVFQYNEPAPSMAGGAVTGTSVSGSTIELIPATLGFTREPGTAIVAGRLHDCADANLANVRVRMFDPDGAFIEPTGNSVDPAYYYFSGAVLGNLPDSSATESARDGLYVVPQVRVADERPYRLEAWANVDGEAVRIGCETARIFPDSVTVLNLGPTRADAPAACQ